MPRANDARDRELRARGKRTMARLLDAGAQVFATKGFHAARVDDIVKAAKTSHGTFYLYFPNKEALFRALAEDVAAQMEGLSEALGPVTPDEAGRAELRAWLDRFSEVYERSGAVIGAWTAAETGDSEVGRIGTELLGGFAVMLARRISRGGAQAAPQGANGSDDVDPNVAAMALVAMIERYQYYALSGMIRADRDAVLDTLAGVTHAALFGAVAAAPAPSS